MARSAASRAIEALERGAGLGDLDRLGHADAAHGGPPVGLPLHQPLGVELDQRGADGRPTHAVALGELQLDQPLTRRERAREDVVAQPVGRRGCDRHRVILRGDGTDRQQYCHNTPSQGRGGGHGRAVKVVLAGEGAIAAKHLAARSRIDGVEVVGLVGGDADGHRGLRRRARHRPPRLRPRGELDRTRRSTPSSSPPPPRSTPPRRQAVMEAGKHVLVEIPMADNLADAEAVVAAQRRTGVTAMVCHTRRFNPSHQWVHRRIAAGDSPLQHLVVSTFFFRRENKNALGQPRTWTDHLLWHHACHTVDLFLHQTGEVPAGAWAQQGPRTPRWASPWT